MTIITTMSIFVNLLCETHRVQGAIKQQSVSLDPLALMITHHAKSGIYKLDIRSKPIDIYITF